MQLVRPPTAAYHGGVKLERGLRGGPCPFDRSNAGRRLTFKLFVVAITRASIRDVLSLAVMKPSVVRRRQRSVAQACKVVAALR